MRDENGVAVRVRTFHPEGGEMMTKQADKDGCDINIILKNNLITGVIPVTTKTPFYGDFSEGADFHDASNRLLLAQADFAALPSALRKHVDNDPGAFLDLISDPDRRAELVDLGLTDAHIPPQADPAPVVPPTPAVPNPAE